VEHPRMYDDADPLLARLRACAQRFPEAAEVVAWGRPTFRAGRKIFAVYGASQHHPHAVVFKPDPEERPALLEDPRFLVPPYFGPGGWLALDLSAPDLDWGEVDELLDSSYRQVALVRMLRVLDPADAQRLSGDGAPGPAEPAGVAARADPAAEPITGRGTRATDAASTTDEHEEHP